eukprot:5151817-Alexandrium_andersonii.AAC.1
MCIRDRGLFFPTPGLILKVAAVLVAAGHRSAAIVLSGAKLTRIENGHPWADALAAARRDASRAA